MRKLSKKISMLMVLAMLVGLFSGVVSASAASAWSFGSSKYAVAVNGSINMESKEYADFDLLKDGKEAAGYTVAWASSDEDVVWVNAKTGQLRANKFGVAEDGDKAVISATFTNNATKKSATRSFTIVLGAAKADFTVEAADATIALGEEVKFAPVVKNADGKAVKFATHKSYNGYFLDGKAIANPWTPEEAGEYTVTIAQFAKKADVADLAKAVRKTDVKVTVTVDADFDAKATGIKEITVYGDFAADAKFTVKKDSKQNISFTTAVAEDGKSAKLALQNKLYKGTYTVTYGDAKVDLAIEDEKVASIVIFEKNGQIYTNPKNKGEAYAHYDVLNQYGESVRKSYDVTWSSSTAGGVEPDVSDGLLKIVRAASGASETFNYGDSVVLTGVSSGYGYAASETATMTIGLENNASTIKVVGIVKKGTSEIINEIPASFAGGDYQLVFEMYNRDGYLMEFDAETAADDFTFTSLNPLLVKEVEGGRDAKKVSKITSATINGKTYGLVNIVPATPEQVKGGGVADIRIVSTKTGVPSEYSIRVVSEQILVDFKIEQPGDVVPATNPWNGLNKVELKYEATDKEGAPITDFRALYNAVSFSPAASIVMEEQNDGSAKLFYVVTTESPSKQNDYPVMLNAIVPGSGATSSVRFSVKYDRIASSPILYRDKTELLEGDSLKIWLRDDILKTWNRDGGIDWADQYDTKIESVDTFGGRLVGVRVIGDEKNEKLVPNAGDYLPKTGSAGDNFVKKVGEYFLFNPNVSTGDTHYDNTEFIFLEAKNNVTKDVQEFAVEFVLYDDDKDEFVGGSDFIVNFKVVDLSQCVGFSAYVEDNYVRNYDDANASWDQTDADATVKYHVEGILANGHKVEIPNYIANAVTGNAVITYKTVVKGYQIDATETDYENVVPNYNSDAKADYEYRPKFNITEATSGNALLFKDQSVKNPDGSMGDRSLKVEVTAKIEAFAIGGNQFKEEVKTSYEVANHGVWNSKLETKAAHELPWFFSWTNGNSEAVIKADGGKITFNDLIAGMNGYTDCYKDTKWGNNSNTNVTISNLRENTATGLDIEGSVQINFNGVKNYGDAVMIENAEIGDTFTVTYENGATHVIKFTVGSDRDAAFSSTGAGLKYY